MNNPILDEKERVQRLLSERAGSVGEYLRGAQRCSEEIERKYGLALKRGQSSARPAAAGAPSADNSSEP